MGVVSGRNATLSVDGHEVASVSSWKMGHVPPSAPVVRMGQSSAATSRNVRQAELAAARALIATFDREQVERNLAATGREPLPSEQKILGDRPKRQITLEE